jgi:hypothetical protein
MVTRGRPKVKKPEDVRTERLVINVTPATLQDIDKWAKNLRLPRSEFVEQLIILGLKDEKIPMTIARSVLLPAMDIFKMIVSETNKEKKLKTT